MKLIQSFWSQVADGDPLINSYGWLKPKYHWISWILSSQLAARNNGKVDLYTDDLGKKILIDGLNLPYNQVYLDLNKLDFIPKNFWAFSKVYTYSLQQEPFLHLDGDVFLWEDLKKRFHGASLITQNLEVATSYYRDKWKKIFPVLDYVPETLRHLNDKEDYYACNLGIVGGENLDFFQDYYRRVKKTVLRNCNSWNRIEGFNFNIFFEQVIFYELARRRNEQINFYFEEVSEDNNYIGMGDFDMVPKNKSYLHLLGDYKRNVSICKAMETYVMINFPESYNRLMKLLSEKGIVNDLPCLSTSKISGFKSDFQDFLKGEKKFLKTKYKLISRDFYNSDLPQVFDDYVSNNNDFDLFSLFELESNQDVLEIPQVDEISTFYELDPVDKILLKEIHKSPINFKRMYSILLKHVDTRTEEVEMKLRLLYEKRIRNYIKIGLISLLPVHHASI